jgi:hypothetical protein
MDLSDADLEQLAATDRRELDPPIEVETATWSSAGQLDLWVKNGSNGGDGYAVRTAVNGGSELLIFVRRAARRYGWSFSFVAPSRFEAAEARPANQHQRDTDQGLIPFVAVQDQSLVSWSRHG